MRAAAAIALFLAFPPFCAAQADAPVAKPEVKPGDRWTYRRMDYLNNAVTETVELRVTFAEKNAILAVTKRQGEQREADSNWTSEWNAVSTDRGWVYKTESGILKFPLQVGGAYDFAFDAERPLSGASRVKYYGKVKVVGWEDIAVPAGKFHALRIETEASFHGVDTSALSSAREVIWYVPEVKRWVKRTYEQSNRGKVPDHRVGEELVDFKVQ